MKNSITSGVEIISTLNILKHLEPVLINWIKTVNEYSNVFNGEDACWWYNERASVGVLAAAAWKTNGWVSLEEFSTQKHGEDHMKNGRCDLYMAKESHKISFAIEAKQAWQNIGENAHDMVSESITQFNLAWRDASKLLKIEASCRLAACFAIPRLPKSQVDKISSQSLEEKIDSWLSEIKSSIQPDIIAWVFPESTRNLASDNDRIFPGVCLLLKVRHRASKT